MKMPVEIWSDVMCPFCYIGKRKFESALAEFPHRDKVQVSWKSFQLDPEMKTQPGKSINAYLSERKGWSLDYTRSMNARVTQSAADIGLHYDFDKAVVANSFDAHRLIQLAKTQELDDAMEEKLFKAYFSEGADISDHTVLSRLAGEAGLDATEARQVLQGQAFAEAVHEDNLEARRIGVTGVPFFVLNRRFAVSGAQDSAMFLEALSKAYVEWISR